MCADTTHSLELPMTARRKDERKIHEESGSNPTGSSENPDSEKKPSNTTCKEEEHIMQPSGNNADGMGDAAALLVMIYLLFIAALIGGAIFLGLFVVVQYGFVIFIAVSSALFGMTIVGATVMSVITRDAKLRRARSKIKSWHVTCKEQILKEIENFQDDYAAYKSDTLLLTYEYEEDNNFAGGGDYNTSPDLAGNATATSSDKDSSRYPAAASSQERKPKSFIFRSVVLPFTKKFPSGKMKQKRSWRRKKSSASSYEPPSIV
eukprot:CAMPEP_0183730778 /NCGR_PEP_ID=MMETSP0737-20130205/33661_1 /TAXON_ID=385413 /ORGANISM="Thalassiosira miniscula, Strain CCMP1093" /LENGTH=262 /DNA_ID=CAMNT_0025963359 /DNA_START=197 /DNA_END=985 /DNA_ORIENTATION=+